MKQYQVVETFDGENTAGTKAVADIVEIADKMGFEALYIENPSRENSFLKKLKRQMMYLKRWNKAYSDIEDNSLVLLQEPFRTKQLGRRSVLFRLKQRKKVKFIVLVHDVEELRKFLYNEYYKEEFSDMCALADAIIVHNSVMKEFFIEKGIPKEKIVVLEIFDYLQDNCSKFCDLPKYERKITIAGNLDPTKCQYIAELKELHILKIQLYGPNFDNTLKAYTNISYGGSLPSNVIPEKLTTGFGLVWDGTTISGCKGNAGEYLKYNNPHKLSLYLSSGLPVVIWDKAAEAVFVKNNKLGIAVNSLFELQSKLENITEDDYNEMARNVAVIAEKLKKGYYAGKALQKSVDILTK